MDSFSERNGIVNREVAITTPDAPASLRSTLVDIAYAVGIKPSALRTIVCRVLFEAPDRNNWSDPNVDGEVRELLMSAAWYDIYDVIEQICVALNANQSPMFFHNSANYVQFERELNRLFLRRGLGWLLVKSRIEYRGDEAVAVALKEAPALLDASGRQTASIELHEAIKDLSRRPSPEVTGAIQHAMAALECAARDLGSSKETLGDLLRRQRLSIPPPLDGALEKLWGYASNNGRHLTEGKPPSFEDAELV